MFLLAPGDALISSSNLNENPALPDKWDDTEGYYRMHYRRTTGQYIVYGYMGQGIFSNVVRACDTMKGSQEVAITIIHNNEMM